MSLSSQLLEREREQLIAHWQVILRKRPTLLECPRVDLRRILKQEGNATGMQFRKVHDSFGWQAKNHVNCAGAIYRSLGFISLDPAHRCGSRRCSSHLAGQNVHIEHTVQAKALEIAWNLASVKRSDADAMDWILSNSIVTAMTPLEVTGIGSLTSIPFLPFQRYSRKAESPVIWNVLDGKRIDLLKFKFDDHRNTVGNLIITAKKT